MKQQKGFSLLEVLISLMLVTTLGLTLLAQQGQTKQLLTQLIVRTKASQFLDQIDESLLVGLEKLPIAPDPYQFILKKNKKSMMLRLNWFKDLGSIIRKHRPIGTV